MKISEQMLRKEIIQAELEELARNFEGSGADVQWTGREISEALRRRIRNHNFLAPVVS